MLRSQLFYKLSIGLLSQYFFGGLGNLNAAYIFKSRAGFRSYVEYRTKLPVTLEITCLQFCLGLSVGEASPVCPHWMRCQV